MVLATVAAVAGVGATENIGFSIMVFFGLAAIVLPILAVLGGGAKADRPMTKDK